jgi:hypothetical protein
VSVPVGAGWDAVREMLQSPPAKRWTDLEHEGFTFGEPLRWPARTPWSPKGPGPGRFRSRGSVDPIKDYIPWEPFERPSVRFVPLPPPSTEAEAWKQLPRTPVLLRADIRKLTEGLEEGRRTRLPEGTLIERQGGNRYRIDGPGGTHFAPSRDAMLRQAEADEQTARAHRFGNVIPGQPQGPLPGVDVAPIDPVGDAIGGMLHGGWVTLPNGTVVHRGAGGEGKGDVFEVVGTDGRKRVFPATDKKSTIKAARDAEARAPQTASEREMVEHTSQAAPGGELQPLPRSFPTTRRRLHRVAEQLLGPAQDPSNEIALISTGHGFGTPVYRPGLEGPRTQMRVEDGDLVREQPGQIEREEIPGVDPQSARQLSDLYSFTDSILRQLRVENPKERPDPVATRVNSGGIIWPEHFDIGIEFGDEGHRANFGMSPGDEAHPQPYFYVGPWDGVDDSPLWNAKGFQGAELSYEEVLAAPDQRQAVLDFFRERLRYLQEHYHHNIVEMEESVYFGEPARWPRGTPWRSQGPGPGRFRGLRGAVAGARAAVGPVREALSREARQEGMLEVLHAGHVDLPGELVVGSRVRRTGTDLHGTVLTLPRARVARGPMRSLEVQWDGGGRSWVREGAIEAVPHTPHLPSPVSQVSEAHGFERMLDFNARLPDGSRLEVRPRSVQNIEEGRVAVDVDLIVDGERAGGATRIFEPGAVTLSGEPEVFNGGMGIDEQFQHRGIASVFNKRMFDTYSKAGIRRVRVHAGRTAGGRAWAKVFDFDTERLRDRPEWTGIDPGDPEEAIRRTLAQQIIRDALADGRISAQEAKRLIDLRIEHPAAFLTDDAGGKALAGAKWPGVRAL